SRSPARPAVATLWKSPLAPSARPALLISPAAIAARKTHQQPSPPPQPPLQKLRFAGSTSPRWESSLAYGRGDGDGEGRDSADARGSAGHGDANVNAVRRSVRHARVDGVRHGRGYVHARALREHARARAVRKHVSTIRHPSGRPKPPVLASAGRAATGWPSRRR